MKDLGLLDFITYLVNEKGISQEDLLNIPEWKGKDPQVMYQKKNKALDLFARWKELMLEDPKVVKFKSIDQ